MKKGQETRVVQARKEKAAPETPYCGLSIYTGGL